MTETIDPQTAPDPAATKWVPVGPGPIVPTAKIDYIGAYNPASAYHAGEYVVGPDGITYMCVIEGTTGVTPTPWAGITVPDGALPLRLGTVGSPITSGDWNTFTTAGWYSVTASGLANAPGPGTWMLFVQTTNSSTVYQIAFQDASGSVFYYRNMSGGSWFPWRQNGEMPMYGTSFPTSPWIGQEYILVDSTSNPSYQWRFRYNYFSSSSYKWEFIGGTPRHATASIGGWSAIGAAGWTGNNPTFTLPRAGDYDIWAGAQFQGAAGQFIQMSTSIQGVGGNPVAHAAAIPPAPYYLSATVSDRTLGRSAGQVIMSYYYTSDGGGQYANAWLKVQPVRCS